MCSLSPSLSPRSLAPSIFLMSLLLAVSFSNQESYPPPLRIAMLESATVLASWAVGSKSCGSTEVEVIIEENYDYYLTEFSIEILQELDKGISFEDAIGKIKYFDLSIRKFVSHGKNNGLIDKELKLFSELMLDTFLTSLDRNLKKLQPILFGILAIVIVGLYMVILLPIFNMASSLK